MPENSASVRAGAGSSSSSSTATCVRCRTTASTLNLPQTGSYCTSCATDIFHIKAKLGLDRARGACLGYAQRSRKGKEKERALNADAIDAAQREEKGIAIGFSGSDASLMLLHAVAQYFLPDGTAAVEHEGAADAGAAKSKRKKKDTRRMDTVAFLNVLYVDQSALSRSSGDGGEAEASSAERIAELERVVQAISPSFKFVPLRLEDVFRPNTSSDIANAGDAVAAAYVSCTCAPSSSRYLLPKPSAEHLTPAQALRQLHDAINPPPSQMPRLSLPAALTRAEDLRRILTQRLLRRAAREQGACSLLLADTASGAAVRFIDAIAKGEGGKAAVEGAPAAWMNDLLICRPLREIHAQEVDFQVQTFGGRAKLATGGNYLSAKAQSTERSSIGRLTNGFIANLESNVASTVSTVTRTASKIVLDLPLATAQPEEEPTTSSSMTPVPSQNMQNGKGQSAEGRDGSEVASKPKWDPSQITFGSAAQRLIRLAEDLPRWDELMQDDAQEGQGFEQQAKACPLCGMPAQSEKAHGWKESISILATPAEVRQAADSNAPGAIDLSAVLCYGCALVLDTPPRIERGPKVAALAIRMDQTIGAMPLPKFVLDAAVKTLRHAEQESNGASNTGVSDAWPLNDLVRGLKLDASPGRVKGQESATRAVGEEEEVRLRKIDQEEMRARIGKFVLDDAEA